MPFRRAGRAWVSSTHIFHWLPCHGPLQFQMIVCYVVRTSTSRGRETEIPSFQVLQSWVRSRDTRRSLKETSQFSRSGEGGNYSVIQRAVPSQQITRWVFRECLPGQEAYLPLSPAASPMRVFDETDFLGYTQDTHLLKFTYSATRKGSVLCLALWNLKEAQRTAVFWHHLPRVG